MRKRLINTILLIIIFMAGVVYGIAINYFKIFPYFAIKTAYNQLISRSYGSWSIGVYEGLNPFNLSDPENIKNPVLTNKSIVDVDAEFVADPFMMINKENYYMFFEVLNRSTNQGDIGYSVSNDGKHWRYKRIIIDETFHLSYPYVFEWEGDYYIIPESHEDLSVRIYKATSFPEKWKYIGNLLTGYHFVDPTIFRYKDKWWLFVSTPNNNILNLYYSDELFGEWKPHLMNPIVKFNKKIARPAGRVIKHNGRLYRFAQDDYPRYGIQVFAFEIIELTENTYKEKMVSEKPLVGMTGKGWNSAGMHHIDLHKVGEKWIAVVDGKNK